eukprot:TRINITY_DN19044_c0_g1_i1.p1 TRINITY_DN19044_c0_g1~~TRINITY_DN19044_c0_g1_i1.p1  ORF type:complete len:500 (-),score=136.07 TRINITY_DN19044_c0_g1_i1:281-1738(-)
MESSIVNEKEIMLRLDSVFIVKLHECYSGKQFVYFLLDVALGGELHSVYYYNELNGDEDHAKYYLGSVFYAFEHMHERHVIYRDLKPENLLLTEHGHLKLTDMGIAKFVVGKTFTCVGTSEYFSPEMISATGHTRAFDWWTFGVLLFELMAGHTPFEAENPAGIYLNVMKGIEAVALPAAMEGDCGDLLYALLKHDAALRLPMRVGGARNIQEHAWFSEFDWQGLADQTLDPPYLPTVENKIDLSNFDTWSPEEMPAQRVYRDKGATWDRNFATVEEPDAEDTDLEDLTDTAEGIAEELMANPASQEDEARRQAEESRIAELPLSERLELAEADARDEGQICWELEAALQLLRWQTVMSDEQRREARKNFEEEDMRCRRLTAECHDALMRDREHQEESARELAALRAAAAGLEAEIEAAEAHDASRSGGGGGGGMGGYVARSSAGEMGVERPEALALAAFRRTRRSQRLAASGARLAGGRVRRLV